MCLRPLSIANPRYRDYGIERFAFSDYYIKVPCGKCSQCRSKRASDWRVRLIKEVELGSHRTVYFVTLTFDEDNLKRFIDTDSPNRSIRLFLERYRKAVGKSLRHWFVVEYGERRGRFHFHGLIFDPLVSIPKLRKLWSYGFVYIERLRGSSGCSYVVKYITKSQAHVGKYSGRVWCSPGLGKQYLTAENISLHRLQYESLDTPGHADLSSGFNNSMYIYLSNYKYSLPRYYRKHIFNDSERMMITRSWCRWYANLAYTPLEIFKLKNHLNAECFRFATTSQSSFQRFADLCGSWDDAGWNALSR